MCTLGCPCERLRKESALVTEITMALGKSARQERGTLKREKQVQISLKACSEKLAEQMVCYVECASDCCPDSQEV